MATNEFFPIEEIIATIHPHEVATEVATIHPPSIKKIVEPFTFAEVRIDWENILRRTARRWTPKTVRRYLIGVVARMNQYFAIAVSGRNLGWIQFTLNNQKSIWLSTWRCRELFDSHKISIVWEENGARMRMHRSAFSLWLKSGNRRELESTPIESRVDFQPPTIALQWLQRVLTTKEVNFNAFNARKKVYQSWWTFVGTDRKHEYSPKRISQLMYQLFPHTRPSKGKRLTFRGKPVLDIPSVEFCSRVVERAQ